MLATELDLSSTKKSIIAFIKRKVEEGQADGAVLGISGGIDSAVTAYLSVEALGSRRVTGLIMPDLRATPDEDVEDAKLVASELCIETKEIDVAPIHKAFMKSLESSRLAEGNLRARIRMSLLYYHANLTNRLVIGTGDRSELLLGYFTKYGDGGVDVLPIADLYKTEVRRLGEALGINRRIVAKRSSPRLWPGQLAESEIGMSYEAIDRLFKLKFEEGLEVPAIASKMKLNRAKVELILAKYQASEHKRQMP
ncbi:MAG TPA: NAD+ synthase, partial [Nitrososphaerales archaeon]|nr:NAD+ synthase [Nitrososphaerales archaeon]